jgi:hypothetical protein
LATRVFTWKAAQIPPPMEPSPRRGEFSLLGQKRIWHPVYRSGRPPKPSQSTGEINFTEQLVKKNSRLSSTRSHNAPLLARSPSARRCRHGVTSPAGRRQRARPCRAGHHVLNHLPSLHLLHHLIPSPSLFFLARVQRRRRQRLLLLPRWPRFTSSM